MTVTDPSLVSNRHSRCHFECHRPGRYRRTGHRRARRCSLQRLRRLAASAASFAGAPDLAAVPGQQCQPGAAAGGRQSAGYAVIIQGNVVQQNEGLAAHNKTANRMYPHHAAPELSVSRTSSTSTTTRLRTPIRTARPDDSFFSTQSGLGVDFAPDKASHPAGH